MIEQAVYSLLTAATTHPVFMTVAADDAPTPYVTYQMQAPIDVAPSLEGPGQLHTVRVQVDVWSTDAASAASVGNIIRAALVGATYAGQSLHIRNVELDGGFDDAELGDGSVPVTYYRRSTDFLFYVET